MSSERRWILLIHHLEPPSPPRHFLDPPPPSIDCHHCRRCSNCLHLFTSLLLFFVKVIAPASKLKLSKYIWVLGPISDAPEVSISPTCTERKDVMAGLSRILLTVGKVKSCPLLSLIRQEGSGPVWLGEGPCVSLANSFPSAFVVPPSTFSWVLPVRFLDLSLWMSSEAVTNILEWSSGFLLKGFHFRSVSVERPNSFTEKRLFELQWQSRKPFYSFFAMNFCFFTHNVILNDPFCLLLS